MTCPRCDCFDVICERRETVDKLTCASCGWNWMTWPDGNKRKWMIRDLLGLPKDHDPSTRWCACDGTPARYVVNGTLGEKVTYCRKCRKYVAIVCPPGLTHGGHYRALEKRLDELAAMAKEGAA